MPFFLRHDRRPDLSLSLLNRLPPAERGQKPIINELQPELHPMEVLYDTKKLLTVKNVRRSSSYHS